VENQTNSQTLPPLYADTFNLQGGIMNIISWIPVVVAVLEAIKETMEE